MSQPGLIYRMRFKNIEGSIILTWIYPTDIIVPDGDPQEIIELTAGGRPLVISASNNDEDKFTPIRSKSAQITFVSDSASGLDSSTFSDGSDSLWQVHIWNEDTGDTIFQGFLMLADNQQPFQPDPEYVTLTATDHLAALKEIALTDLSGDNPLGKYRVASIIAFCLAKTGLSLTWRVVNNLRAGGASFDYSITFNAGTNTITGFTNTLQFYIGQEIVITGTSSNNMTTYVTAMTSTEITVSGTLVTEYAPATTITDYMSTFHWYDKVYIDAKTFEKEIGTCEDCYTVLSKILGEDCFITQWLGEWWIMRVDEFEDNPIYVAYFAVDGTYYSTAAGTTYNKSVGFADDSKFAKADTLLRFVRPHGFVKETFNYTSPLEVPCNIDFSRGDLIDGSNPLDKVYALDCWDLLEGVPGYYGTVDGTTARIHKLYNSINYEIERYIVLTPRTTYETSSINDATYIQSESIVVNEKDRLNVSADYRLTFNTAGTPDVRLMRVVFNGDDGSWWILGEATVGDGIPVWYNTLLWTLFSAKGAVTVDFDSTDWNNISWDCPPVPSSGKVYIWFNQLNQNSAAYDDHDIHYANLRVEYIPLINGSYAKYSGQYSQITRTETGYFANRDKQVFLSDSPTKIYKGAMFLYINSVYVLIPFWFASAPFVSGYPPNTDYLHPYGYIQAFSVWNQYKGQTVEPILARGRGINIFQGSVIGLTTSWPDMLHKYSLTDLNVQTNNRYFMLISVSQDWKSCIWTAVFIEVYNTVLGKSYSDPFTFKYIAQ